MTPIGLVGVGRMGKALTKRLAGKFDLTIYDRDSRRLLEVAGEFGLKTAMNLEDMAKLGAVILAVPDREVISCIKLFNQLQKPLTVINIATNVDRHVLREMGVKNVRCISAKIIGHAEEMILGQKPLIIVDDYPPELVAKTTDIFQAVGEVITGRADLVGQINTIAAEKVLTAAVMIEELLRQHNINNDRIIHSAIGQVAVGTLKAYANSNLGPFAREIVQAIKTKMRN